jgi:hypothetical protein
VTEPTPVDDQAEPTGPGFPTRVLIEAYGIDVRVEGAEPAEQLSRIAMAAFLRVRQLAPASNPTGFAAGSSVHAERAEPLVHPLDAEPRPALG